MSVASMPRALLGRVRPALAAHLAAGALALLACGERGEGSSAGMGAGPPAAGHRPASLDEWRQERARLDETVWADEVQAQRYERSLVALWDRLLAAERRGDEAATRAAFAGVGFDSLRLGTPHAVETLDHGIEVLGFAEPSETLSAPDWARRLEELSAQGYRLVQSEWHHARFTPPAEGAPARSQVSVVLHVLDTARGRRIALDGELAVEWSDRLDERGNFVPQRVDATGLRMLARTGPPPFQEVFTYAWPPGGRRSRLHPVLVYDLDRDGLPDIVLVGAARVLWNRGGGRFQDAPLLEQPAALTETGVIADLDGDGDPDLLSTRARGDLVLYRGDAAGRFRGPPEIVPAFPEPLRAPSVLTVGDVDADGDLDVWLAQYKPAYVGGQMPSPFYDANDGLPSYLLRNDGKGHFSDATEA